MYLNLVQLAESFGVSEKVVEDWIRRDGLPSIPDRNRLLFDREQVAYWAAERGLAAQTGFLAPQTPLAGGRPELESLLRRGGIWRGVTAAGVPEVLAQVVARLPEATPPIRRLLEQRVRAADGVTVAPVGRGLAVPHLSTRIALGRGHGTVALLFLAEPLPLEEHPPDGVPVTRLFFFVAPSPRAHLDLLGRLCRLLTQGSLREQLTPAASDEDIFRALATAEQATAGGTSA